MKSLIVILGIIFILISFLLSKRKTKYKTLLEKLLAKGYLAEDDEKKLNALAEKFKISKKITDEIRSQRMKQDTQKIINRIYSSQLFSEADEKQITEIANKHRINIDFDTPDFRKFRKYWMRSNTTTFRKSKNVQNKSFSIASIKTKEDFRMLIERIDSLNEKYESSCSWEDSSKIEKEIDKLDEIWDKTRDKIWGWQFIPEFSLLENDEKIFDLAYKVFENEDELNTIKNKYPEFEHDFNELTFDDDPEDKPPYIKILKKISQVSKENIPLNEMMTKIDNLSKPYEKSLHHYVNDIQLSIGQFIVASILSNEDAPLPFKLIKNTCF